MKRLTTCFLIFLVALAFVLSHSAPVAAQQADPIKIGGLFELTGFLAPIGKEASRRQDRAGTGGRQNHGRPVEFIVEDSATDVNTSMDKMRKLVEVDKVRIIVVRSSAPLRMPWGDMRIGSKSR